MPEIHTDLVLAAVGEQLGFLGLLAVVALYALLVWRGFRAAFRSGATYSFFLALGLAVLIALQILLIGGGILGVLPLSGVVSPFLSSGRTAMLANFLILGIDPRHLGPPRRAGAESRARRPAASRAPRRGPAWSPSAPCSPRSWSRRRRCRSSRPTASSPAAR